MFEEKFVLELIEKLRAITIDGKRAFTLVEKEKVGTQIHLDLAIGEVEAKMQFTTFVEIVGDAQRTERKG